MVQFQQHTQKVVIKTENEVKTEIYVADTIVMKKDEVIDILKTLEGLKRKLQPLLKT
jgi:hypothetical protein